MIPFEDESDDPIVAEVRRVREDLAKRFNYDLDSICADAQRRTEEARRAGQPVVSLPPRQPKRPGEQAKRAG